MSFGARLRRLRAEHKLTQADLAFRLNSDGTSEGAESKVDTVSISRWERGVLPRLDTAKRIARVFGVSIDSLMDDASETGETGATGTDG